jgi:hypothetical protein
MRKIAFVTFAFAIVFSFDLGGSQKVKAGPFGSRGHWISVDGGLSCINNFWSNNCTVGDQIPVDY